MFRPVVKAFVLLFIVVLSCCATKNEQKITFKEDSLINKGNKLKDIVLVNAGTANRCEIGELIQTISKCNPKVLGLNFLFVGDSDLNCDSILRDAFYESDKVVLVEGFENSQHIESSKKFVDVAFLTGLIGLVQNESEITNEYYRLIDHRGKWEMSFPFLLALQWDKSRAAELTSKISSRTYPIIFYHRIEEFKVLDYMTDFSQCEFIKDRIVIIGSLGPTEEDIYKTPVTKNSSNRTYGTVILANIILDILNDLN